MNRANFFKSSLGVFLFRKPPAVETKPERDHYIGKIRGGQIWKQDDFPCFSVMLVPGCAEQGAGVLRHALHASCQSGSLTTEAASISTHSPGLLLTPDPSLPAPPTQVAPR